MVNWIKLLTPINSKNDIAIHPVVSDIFKSSKLPLSYLNLIKIAMKSAHLHSIIIATNSR